MSNKNYEKNNKYPNFSEFFSRLSFLRKNAGYSQEDLAKLVGASKNALQSWESKVFPRGEFLGRLSAVLDCSLDWLFWGEGEKYRSLKKEDNKSLLSEDAKEDVARTRQENILLRQEIEMLRHENLTLLKENKDLISQSAELKVDVMRLEYDAKTKKLEGKMRNVSSCTGTVTRLDMEAHNDFADISVLICAPEVRRILNAFYESLPSKLKEKYKGLFSKLNTLISNRYGHFDMYIKPVFNKKVMRQEGDLVESYSPQHHGQGDDLYNQLPGRELSDTTEDEDEE